MLTTPPLETFGQSFRRGRETCAERAQREPAASVDLLCAGLLIAHDALCAGLPIAHDALCAGLLTPHMRDRRSPRGRTAFDRLFSFWETCGQPFRRGLETCAERER